LSNLKDYPMILLIIQHGWLLFHLG